MIILRKLFSSNKQQKKLSKKEKEEKKNRDQLLAAGGLGGGGLILSKTKPGRLTGKVVRYHDAPIDVIDKIKEEGLKAKYAEDPNNITNKVLQDVPMDQKKGLVYTTKNKRTAFGVGTQRARLDDKFTNSPIWGPLKEQLTGKSKHHKVLKLEFDYDDDIKGKAKVENPELRGAKNPKDFWNTRKKNAGLGGIFTPEYDDLNPIQKKVVDSEFKALNDNTHVFKGDIDSKHIVGGKGYKKRTMKQVMNYIKKNPKRFGKEVAKVAAGVAAVGYGAKKAVDLIKEDKKGKENKKKEKN